MMNLYLDYCDDELKEFDIVKKFNKHNIIKDRVNLYKDFTVNLIHYIYNTYFGRDYIITDKDIIGHFDWCFNKVIDEFLEEEISFKENDDLYNYFFSYFYAQFYKSQNDVDKKEMIKFWDNIFETKKNNKNRKIFDILLEVYEIFDLSFSKINKKEEYFL